MKKTSAALDARYHHGVATFARFARWPVVGALIGLGVLATARLIGQKKAASEGPQEQVASLRQKLSINGWGEKRR